MPRTLDQLLPGQAGAVREVSAADATLNRRLAEMGITPGETLEVVAVAPWGDPMEIAVRGYRLSLRKAEARCVALAEAADG